MIFNILKRLILQKFYSGGFTENNKNTSFNTFTERFLVKADDKTLIGKSMILNYNQESMIINLHWKSRYFKFKNGKDVIRRDIIKLINLNRLVSHLLLRKMKSYFCQYRLYRYHNNLPINDLRYLSNTEVIDLN